MRDLRNDELWPVLLVCVVGTVMYAAHQVLELLGYSFDTRTVNATVGIVAVLAIGLYLLDSYRMRHS